jgi:hypothetical protein
MAGALEDDEIAGRRPPRLIRVDRWTVADLGPSTCAFAVWDGRILRVVVSDRVHADHVGTVAIHAMTHRSDGADSLTWAETTAWCDTATCWSAQTWLPACFEDLAVQATPA